MAVSDQLTPGDPAVLYVRGGMGPRGIHDALEKRKKLYCLECLYRIRYPVSKIKTYPKKLNKIERILLLANVE